MSLATTEIQCEFDFSATRKAYDELKAAVEKLNAASKAVPFKVNGKDAKSVDVWDRTKQALIKQFLS